MRMEEEFSAKVRARLCEIRRESQNMMSSGQVKGYSAKRGGRNSSEDSLGSTSVR